MRTILMPSKLSGLLVYAAAIVLIVAPASGVAQQKAAQNIARYHVRLAEEVRHQLVLLPYYGVFDDLSFEIQGVDTVVLHGQVTRPTLKDDAGRVVSKLEGAGKVVNKIEVLPLSPNDDQLRLATYRAIYGKPGLDRYALRAVPPIHIIVKNGNITLVGAVGSQSDKDLARLYALQVPGAFSVTNNLIVDSEK